MKVLQINCVNKHGSTGRIVAQISALLDENGVENKVAHGIPRVDEDSYVINSKLDAHMHSFLSRKLGKQGLYSHIPTMKLIRFIRKYDPDIVHLHNLHGHYLNYKLLFEFLRKTDVKVVWTLHDCWAVTGKCSHFAKAGCYRWESDEGCKECVQLSTYPDSTHDASKSNFALKKKLFSDYPNMTLVTVSEWLLDVVKRSYLKTNNALHIHNGIDTDIFRPRESDVRERLGVDGKKMILGVSNIWNGQKGEKEFIKLSEMMPCDYVIVLVGKNSERVAQKSDRIISVPQTKNQTELCELYSAADVFVSTSIEESCSLVVIEALASGTPAVVYNSTGIPENVRDGCGRVVEIGNIEQMLEAIIDIVNSSQPYGEKCVNTVQSKYTVRHMCEGYYDLYRKVLGEEH